MKSLAPKPVGFTLLELLVVIGTVSILAVLITVGAMAAQKKVRQTHCAHNVRQLGLALQVFVTDNHVYPLSVNPKYVKGVETEHQTAWTTALEGVLAPVQPSSLKALTSGIWSCPSAPRPPDYPETLVFVSYGYNDNGLSTSGTSLGLGGHNVWGGQPEGTSPPVKDSEVANPSQLLLLGDGFKGGKGVIVDGVDALRRDDSVRDTLGSTARAVLRHNQRANIAFCDGHVEAPKLKSLFEDNSDKALARWNRDDQPHRDLLAP